MQAVQTEKQPTSYQVVISHHDWQFVLQG